jgi:hypothetical protein
MPELTEMQATEALTDAATAPAYDWELARTLYIRDGLSCSEIATRLGSALTTVKEHCGREKWVAQRLLFQEDAAETWKQQLSVRYLKAARHLDRFEPTSIDDLAKLETAVAKHVDAGMKLFGISEKPDSGPSALVQVNVSTGHAADAGQALRANAAKHAKQARPAPHTQDSTAVPSASDPSKP